MFCSEWFLLQLLVKSNTLNGPCSYSQKKRKKKTKTRKTIHKRRLSFAFSILVLTRFLGCDIDYVALWAHSSAVVSPQTHVIGTAAFQIPDEY